MQAPRPRSRLSLNLPMPHALRRFVALSFCVLATCVNSFSARAAEPLLGNIDAMQKDRQAVRRRRLESRRVRHADLHRSQISRSLLLEQRPKCLAYRRNRTKVRHDII